MYNLYECPSFTCVKRQAKKKHEEKTTRTLQRIWFYLAIINVLWMWDMWAFCVRNHLNFQSHFNLKHCTCCGIGEIKYTHSTTKKMSKRKESKKESWFSSLAFVSFEEDGNKLISYLLLLNLSLDTLWVGVDKYFFWGGEIHVINNVLTRCAQCKIAWYEKIFFCYAEKWIFSHSDCP